MVTIGEDGRLRLGGDNGTVLIPRSETEFDVAAEEGSRIVFNGLPQDGPVGFERRYEDGVIDVFEPMGGWEPSIDDLEDFEGLYTSEARFLN